MTRWPFTDLSLFIFLLTPAYPALARLRFVPHPTTEKCGKQKQSALQAVVQYEHQKLKVRELQLPDLLTFRSSYLHLLCSH